MIDMTAFLATLPIMGKGMAGIFIVMAVLLLAVKALGKIFPEG